MPEMDERVSKYDVRNLIQQYEDLFYKMNYRQILFTDQRIVLKIRNIREQKEYSLLASQLLPRLRRIPVEEFE